MDGLILTGIALGIVGGAQSRNNVYRILGWADNSGSIDSVTDKNVHANASIGNVSPNMGGLGELASYNTSRLPLPPPKMARHLNPVCPTHPGATSALITNFGASSLRGQ